MSTVVTILRTNLAHTFIQFELIIDRKAVLAGMTCRGAGSKETIPGGGVDSLAEL